MVRNNDRRTAPMREFRFTTSEFEPTGRIGHCQKCGEALDLTNETESQQVCPDCR